MKFPVFTCVCIMFVAIFLFLYTVFNFALHNPDSGAFTLIDQQRDVMMDANYSSWAQDLLNFQHNLWGTGFCVLVVMTIVCAFIDVIRSPRDSME